MQTYLADASIVTRIGETFIDLCAAVLPSKSRHTRAHKCQMEILNIVVNSYNSDMKRYTLTSQVPPFLHVPGWHSFVSLLQFLPSKPGEHVQK